MTKMYQTSGNFLWTRFILYLLFLDRFLVIRHLQHEVFTCSIYILHVYNVNMLFFYQSPVEFYWSIVLRYPYHIEVFLQMDLATPLPIMRLPMTWLLWRTGAMDAEYFYFIRLSLNPFYLCPILIFADLSTFKAICTLARWSPELL